MKVISKQKNSKMCFICGLDNPYGVKAPFYNMEDDSVVTIFQYKEPHQSFPNRVHGGLITAMLDELGLRALWVVEDQQMGVTLSLETKYRKPVPYGIELKGVGRMISNTAKFVKSKAEIMDMQGNILATGEMKYIKLDNKQITENLNSHEEMCYLIEDKVTQIEI